MKGHNALLGNTTTGHSRPSIRQRALHTSALRLAWWHAVPRAQGGRHRGCQQWSLRKRRKEEEEESLFIASAMI
jgi:hypothetical protein